MNWREFGAWLAWQLTVLGIWAWGAAGLWSALRSGEDVMVWLIAFLAVAAGVKLIYESNRKK